MPIPLNQFLELKSQFYELQSQRIRLLYDAKPALLDEYEQVCSTLYELASNLRQSKGNYQPHTADEAVRQDWLSVKGDADAVFRDLLKKRVQAWEDAVTKNRLNE